MAQSANDKLEQTKRNLRYLSQWGKIEDLPKINNQPFGSITSWWPKSLWTKAYDALEESWLLPRWMERRNQWAVKAQAAWAAKWIYDTTVQWTRDLWWMALNAYTKSLPFGYKIADPVTDAYYKWTSFLDKPDEALTNYAYKEAWKDRAPVMLDKWNVQWTALSYILPFAWEAAASSRAGSTKALLKDLAKNPNKYNYSEAANIVRNAKDAWVKNVKSWKVKLTPEQVHSKYNQAYDAAHSNWEIENFSPYSYWEEAPAYQQKLYADYNNATKTQVNWPMRNYRSVPPSQRFTTYGSERTRPRWDDWVKKFSPKEDLNNLYRSLTEEEIAEMNNALRAWSQEPIPEWLYNQMIDEASNTSRARAAATKKRNMSARERAARERAEDSANELRAAWRWRWAKKVQTTLDDIAFEDWFASLEDAERFARADWFKSYKDAKLAWRDYRALNEQLIAKNELDAAKARADVADQTLEEMFEEWKRLNRQ